MTGVPDPPEEAPDDFVDEPEPEPEPGPEAPPTAYERLLVREAGSVVETEARRIARAFHRIVRPNGVLTLGDLLAIGHAALYRAARAYDKDENPKFGAFARYRVRGALLDALDDLLFEERIKVAAAKATDNLLAHHRGDDYNVMKHDEAEARRRYRAFMNGIAAATFTAGMEEASQRQGNAERDELRDYEHALVVLRSALRRFSEADQRLLSLLYRDLLTLKQASARLGLPYATARAHHTRALTVLHELLVTEGIARAPRPAVALSGGVLDGLASPQNDTGGEGIG
jgi:RNA polymerase sigma factor (sigma-70 family)